MRSPQISAITLGVKDLNRAKTFYGDGLGCKIEQDTPGFVSFKLGNGSSSLALYKWDAVAADAGISPEGTGFHGVTLNYVVNSTNQVDEMLDQAKRAGGKILKPGQKAQWGGYFGHFSDLDGYLWKVAAAA